MAGGRYLNINSTHRVIFFLQISLSPAPPRKNRTARYEKYVTASGMREKKKL